MSDHLRDNERATLDHVAVRLPQEAAHGLSLPERETREQAQRLRAWRLDLYLTIHPPRPEHIGDPYLIVTLWITPTQVLVPSESALGLVWQEAELGPQLAAIVRLFRANYTQTARLVERYRKLTEGPGNVLTEAAMNAGAQAHEARTALEELMLKLAANTSIRSIEREGWERAPFKQTTRPRPQIRPLVPKTRITALRAPIAAARAISTVRRYVSKVAGYTPEQLLRIRRARRATKP